MSLYHYRKDDFQNTFSSGGKAIHLFHCLPAGKNSPRRGTLLGACWRSKEARLKEGSLIELVVFCFFFRWYFRIRTNSIMERIRNSGDVLGDRRRIITDMWWGSLRKMYSQDFDELKARGNEPSFIS